MAPSTEGTDVPSNTERGDEYAQGADGKPAPDVSKVEAGGFAQKPEKGFLRHLMTGGGEEQDESFYQYGSLCEVKEPIKYEVSMKDFLAVAKRIPGHWLQETFQAVPGIILGCYPMILCGLASQVLVNGFPMGDTGLPGSGFSLKEAEYQVHLMPLVQAFFAIIPGLNILPVAASIFYVITAALWKGTFPRYAKAMSVWCIFCFVMWFARVVMSRAVPDKAASIDKLMFILFVGALVATMATITSGIGRRTGNPHFCRAFSLTLCLVLGTYYFYRIFMNRIVSGSETTKLIVAVFFTPIVMHVFILPTGRLMGRSMRNCDPSMQVWMVGICLCWEKAFTRVIVATLTSLVSVGIASIASVAVTGIVINLGFGIEDFRVYRFLGRRLKLEQPMQNVHFPKFGWESKREETFRIGVYTFDFACDMAMIFACAAWVLFYRIGDKDGNMPTVPHLAGSVATQLISEYLVNTSLIFWVTFRQGMDFMTLARRKCQYWPLFMASMCAFPVSIMCGSLIVQIVCKAPVGSEATFVLCS